MANHEADRLRTLRSYGILDTAPEQEYDDLAALAAQMLRRLGYEAVIATNGREALALLQRGNFDFVLMDVEMPEMDGLEATARIRRELPATAQPVIVAATAHALTGDRPRFIAAGMDDALTKPLRIAELQRVLAERVRPAR